MNGCLRFYLFQQNLWNSLFMKKTQKKSWAWRSLYIWYRIMLIYINFKFNFLTKYHSFILNCGRIRMFASRRFTNHLQHSRTCCIGYRAFAHDVTAAMLAFQFQRILIRLFCLELLICPEHQHGRHGFGWVGPWGMSANALNKLSPSARATEPTSSVECILSLIMHNHIWLSSPASSSDDLVTASPLKRFPENHFTAKHSNVAFSRFDTKLRQASSWKNNAWK
jgi:hypothetical protein